MSQPEAGSSIAHLVLQLGAILIAAKLGAELAERLGQPTVLGELLAGVAIGPFALGGIVLPLVGEPLFTRVEGSTTPISAELYGFAQVAAVLLLFLIGLNTDLLQFLRYSHAAALVAVGGNLLSFALGVVVAVAFGLASGPTDPRALFLGGIIATTSVAVSARVLADLGKLDTPEGVTILGGAVVDDVLGIIGLSLAVSIATGHGITAATAVVSGALAVGILVVLTVGTLLVVRLLAHLPLRLRTEGASVGVALGCALVAGYAMQQAGLAMILGAYAVGLALSQTSAGRAIERALAGVRLVLVPVFFVVMGTLVNVPEMARALGLGLALCLAAVLGKAVGCGLPALAVGFRGRRAVGIVGGMLPRGEVALIVAGVGLSSGIIGGEIFGVAILLVIVTTVLASLLLGASFQPEIVGPIIRDETADRRRLNLSAAVADLFLQALEATLGRAGLTQVVRYHDLEGREIAEFGKPGSDEYLSVALQPAEDGLRVMDIEYGAGNWPTLVAASVDEAIRQVTYEVLEPLLGDADDARIRARRYLVGLLQTDEELGA
jgi:Kef-type K+ transport system membrane component KefB